MKNWLVDAGNWSEKVLFTAQVIYHLVLKLLKNSSMVYNKHDHMNGTLPHWSLKSETTREIKLISFDNSLCYKVGSGKKKRNHFS